MIFLFLVYLTVFSAPIHVQKRAILSKLFSFKNIAKELDNTAVNTAVNTARQPSPALQVLRDISGKVYPLANIPGTILFKKIGNVIPTEKLGNGQHAVVFLTDAKVGLNEKVAVKIPKFIPEVETQFKLDHKQFIPGLNPNEIGVLKKLGQYLDDIVLEDGRVVIAMKLVKGTSLKSLIEKGEIKTKEQLAQLIKAAKKTVEELHSKGVIHNDLHVGNIMVEKNNGLKGILKPFTVRFIDFGASEIVSLKTASNSKDKLALIQMFATIAKNLE